MYEQENIKLEALITALSKMFDKNIIRADYQIKELKGCSVKLVSGDAETFDGEKLPYKVVHKIQKGERHHDAPGDDPCLCRREYDLCVSDFNSVFSDSDSFRWAKCYHAEMNDDEWQV